jgi:hypothetical protein
MTLIDVTERTQVRHPAHGSGVSRMTAWSRIGRIRTASVVLKEASERYEEHAYRNRLADAPHGAPWFSSFHASSFPGDERACERLLAYKLLGIPEPEPFAPWLRGTMVAGQAWEDWQVDALDLDGRLLTPPSSAAHQLRIEHADHWLTGSPDIVILPPGWNRPHYVETKSKAVEVVAQMLSGSLSYDPKHECQVRAGIGLLNRVSQQLWPEVVICRRTWRLAKKGSCRDHAGVECLMTLKLEPCTTGSLVYGGRDKLNPAQVADYFFEHDEAQFQRGLATLDRVRDAFERDELPPHPFGGKEWSQDPCKWCPMKKEACRPDHAAGTTKLSESRGAEWAKKVYGSYDVKEIMSTVVSRWRGRSGVAGVLPKS